MPQTESIDKQGMETLYHEHHGWLFAWLRRKLGCSHHAADLVQDTYLRLIVSDRLPNPSQERPFLMQVAKGLLVDRYRRQQLEQRYLEALANLPESLSPSCEEKASALQLLWLLDKALNSLPSIIRNTFLLSQFDGLKYKEIAKELNIAESTVRKYMLKATEKCWSVFVED